MYRYIVHLKFLIYCSNSLCRGRSWVNSYVVELSMDLLRISIFGNYQQQIVTCPNPRHNLKSTDATGQNELFTFPSTTVKYLELYWQINAVGKKLQRGETPTAMHEVSSKISRLRTLCTVHFQDTFFSVIYIYGAVLRRSCKSLNFVRE